MTGAGIEPRSPGPLANTLTVMPMYEVEFNWFEFSFPTLGPVIIPRLKSSVHPAIYSLMEGE